MNLHYPNLSYFNGKPPRATKQISNKIPCKIPLQFCRINRSRGSIFRDILRNHPLPCKVGQKVNRNNTFACSRTSLNNQNLLLPILAYPGHQQSSFVYQLLVIDHYKSTVPLQHGSNRIGKLLRRPQFTILNPVHYVSGVSILHISLYEVPELHGISP